MEELSRDFLPAMEYPSFAEYLASCISLDPRILLEKHGRIRPSSRPARIIDPPTPMNGPNNSTRMQRTQAARPHELRHPDRSDAEPANKRSKAQPVQFCRAHGIFCFDGCNSKEHSIIVLPNYSPQDWKDFARRNMSKMRQYYAADPDPMLGGEQLTYRWNSDRRQFEKLPRRSTPELQQQQPQETSYAERWQKSFSKGCCPHGIRIHTPEDECLMCRTQKVPDQPAVHLDHIYAVYDHPEVIAQSLNGLRQKPRTRPKMTDELLVSALPQSNEPTIRAQRIHPDAKVPVRATPGDAGYDLFALENVLINPGEGTLVPTGLKLEIPAGYCGLIKGRSGMACIGIDT